MGPKISEEELEAMVDAAMEAARNAPQLPYIIFAKYHAGAELGFLEMRLTDGRRLLVPREDLGELKHATDEQAKDIIVLDPATAVYWPQLDDGLDLMDFLEYRWRKEPEAVAA